MPDRQSIEDFAAKLVKLSPEMAEEFKRLMSMPETYIPRHDFRNVPITGVVPGFNDRPSPEEAPFEPVFEEGKLVRFVRRKKV